MSKKMVEHIKGVIAAKVVGVWEARHTDTEHFYCHVPTQTVVRSVTTKLILPKPRLTFWAINLALDYVWENWNAISPESWPTYRSFAANLHTEKRDEAGDIGTQAHDIIEKYLQMWLASGIRPGDIRDFGHDKDPRAIAAARAAEQIILKHKVVPIAAELLVGSLKAKCAGTLDFLCLYDGQPTLLDWKSSNSINETYAMQVAAYRAFFKEMTGIVISSVKVVKLSKEMDRFDVYRLPYLNEAYAAYKGLARAYDWRENGKDKYVRDIKKLIIK